MRLERVRAALQEGRVTQNREIRHAIEMVRALTARIGRPVDPSEGVPRGIRRQQWSAFNVPLVWAAANGDRSCPMLGWLANSVRDISIPARGVDTRARGHERVGR